MRNLVLATGLSLALAGAAFAQSGTGNNSTATSGSQSQGTIRQQVQNDLAQAGFTDIKVMPESFLVRAKDKSGNPVMMVINPDSVTAVTGVPSTSGSGGGASNGSSSSTGSSSGTGTGNSSAK